MIELSEHFGFAFEVFDGFCALALVGEHLDHLFDGAQAVGEPFVAGLIDRSHAAAADAAGRSSTCRAGACPALVDATRRVLVSSTQAYESSPRTAARFYNDRRRRKRRRVLPGAALSAKRVSRLQLTAAFRTEHKAVRGFWFLVSGSWSRLVRATDDPMTRN